MMNGAHEPQEELMQPEEITREALYALLTGAYMNVFLDNDGDIYLKDRFKSWIFPEPERGQIRLMSQFRANTEAAFYQKLEYVNTINDRLRVLRAYVDNEGDIGFDYYILAEGGVTKRNLVTTIRRFVDFVSRALDRDEQNVIA